jgi:hypothetical protein
MYVFTQHSKANYKVSSNKERNKINACIQTEAAAAAITTAIIQIEVKNNNLFKY